MFIMGIMVEVMIVELDVVFCEVVIDVLKDILLIVWVKVIVKLELVFFDVFYVNEKFIWNFLVIGLIIVKLVIGIFMMVIVVVVVLYKWLV